MLLMVKKVKKQPFFSRDLVGRFEARQQAHKNDYYQRVCLKARTIHLTEELHNSVAAEIDFETCKQLVDGLTEK